MGWCSGTEIFDDLAEYVLESDRPDQDKIDTLMRVATALENNDWDCQADSAYYDDPIVQRVFQEMHPSWFEDEDDSA